MNGGSTLTGATMLAAYSAGLGVPFLVAALGIGWVGVTLRKYGKVMRYVEIVMGVILIIIGFMLFSGTLNLISGLVDTGL